MGAATESGSGRESTGERVPEGRREWHCLAQRRERGCVGNFRVRVGRGGDFIPSREEWA
jgi:hypothetical protein